MSGASHKQLAKRIREHLQFNPMTAVQTGYDMQGEGASILDEVRKLNPKKTANKNRIMMAQFVIMHYTMEAMTLGMGRPDPEGGPPMDPSQGPPPIDEAQLAKFKEAQKIDMELAWKILSARGFNNPELGKAAAVLKIDIAQRLEDSVKLSETFNYFTRSQLQPQDLMVACTAAPFLANWQAAHNLVKRAEKLMSKQLLNMQWHQMAQSMPIPDYSVLFKLANEAQLHKRKTPDPKTLQWGSIKIGKIRVLFDKVDCGPFPEKAEELLEEIRKSPIEWEEIKNAAQVQIKRMGGFYQTVSFGEMPMSLCGPVVEEEDIHVKGHMELVVATGPNEPPIMDPSQVDPSKMVVQAETWKLRLVPNTNPRVFKGTYRLDQGPMKIDKSNPETAPVNMEFKLEMYEEDSEGNTHALLEGEEVKEDVPAVTAAATATGPSALKSEPPAGVPKAEDPVAEVITEIDGLSMD